MAAEARQGRTSSSTYRIDGACRLDDRCHRGIHRAHEYLSDFNPRAATLLAEALFNAGESLQFFPGRGRPVPRTDMRELMTVHPYVIRYRVDGDVVVILRVRHSSRWPTDP